MSDTTTRLLLPRPELDDPADGPDAFDQLTNDLDGMILVWAGSGILSDRPVSTSGSPGLAGRVYLVRGDSTPANNNIVWLDYGTGWVQVGVTGLTIPDRSIVAVKIVADAITSAELAANSVTSSELADASVDTVAIIDAAVTAAKIAEALKPSAGAGGSTEALRALGAAAGTAAAGNDSRLPTAGQKSALAGTVGTPGDTNRYRTADDDLSDAAYAIATSAAGLGAGVGGKPGLLRLGSTPFDYLAVVYDDERDLWVSAAEQAEFEKLAGHATTFEMLGGTLSGPIGPSIVTPWKIFETAGMHAEMRLIGFFSRSGAGTAKVRIGWAGTDVGGAAPDDTGITTIAASEKTDTTGSYKLVDSGWVAMAGGYTVKDLLQVGVALLNTSGGSSNLAQLERASLYLRWVS